MKSDDQNKIGRHVFEVAGLGKAPFRCIGVVERKFSPHPSVPAKPGGCCKYCGMGIMYCCVIRSADGQTFEVGSDCVAKTGDRGLIQEYKSRPEVRKANRAKAAARDQRVRQEWAALTADEAIAEKLRNSNDFLARANRSLPFCGAKGRGEWLRAAKQLLAKIDAEVAA